MNKIMSILPQLLFQFFEFASRHEINIINLSADPLLTQFSIVPMPLLYIPHFSELYWLMFLPHVGMLI